MSVRRRLAIAAVMWVFAAAGGCAGSDPTEEQSRDLSCEQRESRDYPSLEQVARKTLGSEPHKLSRAGACKDTGSPRATVQAILPQWDSRASGVKYLETRGWRPNRGGLLLSKDKKFAAESSEYTAPDAKAAVVILTFTRFIDKQ